MNLPLKNRVIWGNVSFSTNCCANILQQNLVSIGQIQVDPSPFHSVSLCLVQFSSLRIHPCSVMFECARQRYMIGDITQAGSQCENNLLVNV
ncbi:hypothetical protein J4Q44_G00032310 [Coregonus suidteri]|uniref:Uncharacterized protein n=1 Tax=Coregonus suidteri TaxID=861788 RepID=A0AAN8NH98_9TELE